MQCLLGSCSYQPLSSKAFMAAVEDQSRSLLQRSDHALCLSLNCLWWKDSFPLTKKDRPGKHATPNLPIRTHSYDAVAILQQQVRSLQGSP